MALLARERKRIRNNVKPPNEISEFGPSTARILTGRPGVMFFVVKHNGKYRLIRYYMGDEGRTEKIKLAIKGKRVLSEDRWRFQYSPWRDKVIEKEMLQKGFKTVDELCRYKPDEIRMMMDSAGLEHRKTKDGRWMCGTNGERKLFKRK